MRALDKWLLPWLKRKVLRCDQPIHVFLAVCDHFEPLHDTDKAGALARIAIWQERFPKLIDPFRDADGCRPKHTFFYPVEQYDPDLLEPIAELCRKTGSEVEIHLHHENDTEEGVREALEKGKRDLRSHGLLSTDQNGDVRYGFIHGNWALNNCHPEGKGCGVDREIPILRSTGCYADFTMPSAPSPTQARVVNSIGYLDDLPGALALDALMPVESNGETGRRDNLSQLLMIQGPLALNFRWRKWGIIPRIENGDLTGANPATVLRFRLACAQGISIPGRPDWVFVKYHTHGGIERNFEMLLGDPMKRFHEGLAREEGVIVHYTTAREMANLVLAAEDGENGNPGDYRDYRFRL